MIDLSLAGLLGAIAGTVVAAVAYAPLVVFLERRFRSRDPSQSADERAMFEKSVTSVQSLVEACKGINTALA